RASGSRERKRLPPSRSRPDAERCRALLPVLAPPCVQTWPHPTAPCPAFASGERNEAEVAWASGDEVADVMEGAGEDAVAVATLAAAGAGPVPVVPAAGDDARLGQVLGASDTFAGVGQILSGAGHDRRLLKPGFPANKVLPRPGEVMTNSR